MSSQTLPRNLSSHEDRTEGEVRPCTAQEAVRQAHSILSGAGVTLAPSKVSRLARDFLRADPPCTFRSYMIRNAGASVGSLIAPGVRHHGIEWADPTGETAARNVDREQVSARATA